jgi:hypothetical protein
MLPADFGNGRVGLAGRAARTRRPQEGSRIRAPYHWPTVPPSTPRVHIETPLVGGSSARGRGSSARASRRRRVGTDSPSRCPKWGEWRPRQVSDTRLQPTTCPSRAGTSGSPRRRGNSHEGRVPARRTLAAFVAAGGSVQDAAELAGGSSSRALSPPGCRPQCQETPASRRTPDPT